MHSNTLYQYSPLLLFLLIFISSIQFSQRTLIKNIAFSPNAILTEINQIWNKTTILFPSDDFILVRAKYDNFSFPQYVYKRDDLISRTIRRKKKWPDCEDILRILTQYVEPPLSGGVFVDVGSNIGSCSLMALSMNLTAIAFEPVPSNIHLFTRSLMANPSFLPKITLYPIAISNQAYSKLTLIIDHHNVGATSAIRGFSRGIQSDINVTSSNLNTVLSNFNKEILFMKVDVEGYEPFVLLGADHLLKQNRIKIIFYERSCAANRALYEELDQLLLKYNYTQSSTECKHKRQQINVLVISNDFFKNTKLSPTTLPQLRFNP